VPNAPGASRLPAPSALLGPPNNMIGPGTDFGMHFMHNMRIFCTVMK